MAPSAVRWAIVGTGSIANRFAADMRFSRTGVVAAIASRSPDRAQALAAAVGPDVAHGATETVLSRPDIDAVYVATTNVSHVQTALAALAEGKPVLVEKPLATNAADAAALADAARSAGLLAMEAMWMRFTPGVAKLKALLDAGAIGEIRSFQAELSFAPSYRPDAALFDPDHGGALLDLGVYPLSLARYLLGEAEDVTAPATRFDNGAIAAASLVARHGPVLASLACGLEAEGRNEAHIVGTRGVIRVHRPFFCPAMLSLRHSPPASPASSGPADPAPLGRRPAFAGVRALRQMVSAVKGRRIPVVFEGTGLHYQADHFADCLRQGLCESPVMPLAQSIDVLRLVDKIRGDGVPERTADRGSVD